MQKDILFSCRDLTVKIDDQLILNSVSFDICQNDHVAFVGSSGSGKSTLLKVLLGFVKPTSGSVFFKEKLLNASLITDLRKEISVLFQEPKLFGESVEDILFQPFTFNCNKNSIPSRADINEIFRDIGLSVDILNKNIEDVSGGEKQRIALTRSLLLKREIVFADEPTSALDVNTRDMLSRKLFNQSNTIVVVTHDNELAKLCNKVYKIENGRIISGVNNANS